MDHTLPKGERTRQNILEAAYALFLNQGFHGTSMRQIAGRAGLAPGSIYNHFTSKEAIWETLFQEKHPYHHILRILGDVGGDTVEEFLHNAAQAIIHRLGQQPEFLKVMFIEIVEFNGAHMPSLVMTVYPQILPFFQRLVDEQDRLRDIPIPILYRAFVGLFFSYYITGLMLGNSDLPIFREGSPEQFVDIFLHGILKRVEGK